MGNLRESRGLRRYCRLHENAGDAGHAEEFGCSDGSRYSE
jgi:hypothetical protein